MKIRTIKLLILGLFVNIAWIQGLQAQECTISTVAGVARSNTNTDDLENFPASEAYLRGNTDRNIIVDKQNHLIFATYHGGCDANNHENARIWKVDPTGNMVMFANIQQLSCYHNANNIFDYEDHKLAMDDSGSLYVLNGGNATVRVDPDGSVSNINQGFSDIRRDNLDLSITSTSDPFHHRFDWRSDAIGTHLFYGQFDAAGNYYYVISEDIHRVDRNGVDRVIAGNLDRRAPDEGPASEVSLGRIYDMKVSSGGEVYIAESKYIYEPFEQRGDEEGVNWGDVVTEVAIFIRKIDHNGIVTTLNRGLFTRLPSHGFSRMALDGQGNLIIISQNFTQDPAYLGHTFNITIYRYDRNGNIALIAGGGHDFGSDGADARSEFLSEETQISFDAQGNMYFLRKGLRGSGQGTFIRKLTCPSSRRPTAMDSAWDQNRIGDLIHNHEILKPFYQSSASERLSSIFKSVQSLFPSWIMNLKK